MPIYKMEGKKDGLQKYRVRINYVDASGKSKQIDRVAYGNPAAKALESKLIHEIHEEKPAANLTVEELYKEYTENKKMDVRETSLDKTKRILSAHVVPRLGDIKINKLNNQILQGWKQAISGLGLAISTRQNIFGEFRAMLNYAVKMGYLPKNPLSNVGNFKDPYDVNKKEKLHYYTPEQFKKYIAVARKTAVNLTDWGYYVFFNIAFYTGMRKGEINALKWTDIDGEMIHVRRSIAQKLKGGDRETPPKNKSSYRSMQMPKPLIQILDEHKKRQESIDGFTEDFRICGGIKCLRDTSISNMNIRYAEEAGLAPIRIHDFRHSHASLLANEGINIQEIARRLGHSKIEITWNTYSHLYPREEERAVQILNKIQ
ncbi:MAG: site-specific integrase [Clostridia bacterium]